MPSSIISFSRGILELRMRSKNGPGSVFRASINSRNSTISTLRSARSIFAMYDCGLPSFSASWYWVRPQAFRVTATWAANSVYSLDVGKRGTLSPIIGLKRHPINCPLKKSQNGIIMRDIDALPRGAPTRNPTQSALGSSATCR